MSMKKHYPRACHENEEEERQCEENVENIWSIFLFFNQNLPLFMSYFTFLRPAAVTLIEFL